MKNALPSLAEQVKEAERDKLIVEKKKFDKEIEKLSYDIKHAKSAKWYTFWGIMTGIATIGTLLFLYIEYGFKPVLETETRTNTNKNLVQEYNLTKLRIHLDTVNTELKTKTAKVKQDSIKYDSLLTNYNIKINDNKSLNRVNNNLNSEIKSSKDTLSKLKLERKRLQPLVDSLKNIADIEDRKRHYSPTIRVLIRFQKENSFESGSVGTVLVAHSSDNKILIFNPVRINGVSEAIFELFCGDVCKVKLNRKDVKLKDINFQFVVDCSKETQEVIIPVK